MKRYPIVRRNKGWFKRRHGIKLEPLQKAQQDILLNNTFVKRFADDDRFIQALFWVADMESQAKPLRMWWPNPYNGKITKFKDIVNEANSIKWPCAICEETVSIKMDDYSWRSFCCSECLEKQPKRPKNIDDRIVNSTLAFTKYCKGILQKRQKRFISLAKGASKD